MDPPEEVARFGAVVATILGSILGGDFVGACYVGSIALGGYVEGRAISTSLPCVPPSHR